MNNNQNSNQQAIKEILNIIQIFSNELPDRSIGHILLLLDVIPEHVICDEKSTSQEILNNIINTSSIEVYNRIYKRLETFKAL